MRKIIALEGLPCGGKTTFFNKFRDENPDFYCIPELYIEPKNDDTTESVRQKYVEAEILKTREIGNVHKDIICDRSFISTLAFSYAKQKLTGSTADYEFNKQFLDKNRQSILIPDFVFLFSITPQESIERRKRLPRDNTLNFWVNEFFLKSFADFYNSEEFKNIFFSEEKTVTINTVTETEESAIYEIVSSKIKNHK